MSLRQRYATASKRGPARRSPPTPGCLSADAIRAAVPLFDLQVWLWGQDVLHARGNGLVQFGFERRPPPPRVEAASIYRLQLPRGRRIVLRGYGLFYSDALLGGLFLERFVFVPKRTAALDLPSNAWHRPMLPDLAPPCHAGARRKTRLLVRRAVRWMADYEDWAWDTLGPAHRRFAVRRWERLGKPVVRAGQLAAAWRDWWSNASGAVG